VLVQKTNTDHCKLQNLFTRRKKKRKVGGIQAALSTKKDRSKEEVEKLKKWG